MNKNDWLNYLDIIGSILGFGVTKAITFLSKEWNEYKARVQKIEISLDELRKKVDTIK